MATLKELRTENRELRLQVANLLEEVRLLEVLLEGETDGSWTSLGPDV